MICHIGQRCIDISMGHDKPREVTVVGERACHVVAAGAIRPVVEDSAGRTWTAIPHQLRPIGG